LSKSKTNTDKTNLVMKILENHY